MADKKQTSVPILGIDTASPDHNVKDGKCSDLHNLRYSAGAWRNVHPFIKKQPILKTGYNIIYHHPADVDNNYIAIGDPLGGTIYYAWVLRNEETTIYSLKRPNKILRGDELYIKTDDGKFEKSGFVQRVTQTDGITTIYKINDRPQNDMFAYNIVGTTFHCYARSEFVKKDDILYSYTERDGWTSVGKVEHLSLINGNIQIVAMFDKEQPEDSDVVVTRAIARNPLEDWSEEENMPLYKDGYIYTENRNDVALGNKSFLVINVSPETGAISVKQELQKYIDGVEYKVSHFGKVLIISDSSEYKFRFYILNNDGYTATSIDGCLCKLSINSYSIVASNNASLKVVNNNSIYRVTEPFCSLDKTTLYFSNTQDDLWRGEIAIFAAARSSDGGILYTTPIQIFNTALAIDKNSTEERVTDYIDGHRQDNYYVVNDAPAPPIVGSLSNIATYCGTSQLFTDALVSITIPTELENSQIVDNIALYCTRLYPLFLADEQYFVQTAELPNEPFYLLKVMPVNDFFNHKESYIPDASYNLIIKSSDLNNIENSVVYEPTQTINNVFGSNLFEYNNRLHILGTTYTPTRLDIQSIITEPTESDDNIYRRYIIVEYTRNSKTYYSIFPIDAYSAKFPYESADTKAAAQNQGFLLTFAGKIVSLAFAGKTSSGEYVICAKYKMSYSSSLNISYYIGQPILPSYLNKYADIVLPAASEVENEPRPIVDTKYILDSNRIQVSESNNCFVFPFENSYRVGSESNKIIAANSAAIEMSDAKFGEFPLYVFTDEGIFTMQSGTDTLYSAIIPIAYDKAINPNTLAINYNVLFITARGLMALSSNGIVCISAELNSKDNLILELLRTAKLTRLPKYNEVMAANEGYNIAYIYSLDNKVWSTRDINLGNILNNNEMIANSGEIIDITDESDTVQSMPVVIDTRQIKLDTMELKRAETVIIRFESTIEQNINIEIYGSINLKSWILIRAAEITTNKDIIIRRVPMSVKYLRLRIYGTATDNIKIMPIDIEYYLRMLHRMR